MDLVNDLITKPLRVPPVNSLSSELEYQLTYQYLLKMTLSRCSDISSRYVLLSYCMALIVICVYLLIVCFAHSVYSLFIFLIYITSVRARALTCLATAAGCHDNNELVNVVCRFVFSHTEVDPLLVDPSSGGIQYLYMFFIILYCNIFHSPTSNIFDGNVATYCL